MRAKPRLAVPKKRLDLLLVERGLVDSRQKAQAIILAGEVRVNGRRADKSGSLFPTDAQIELTGRGSRFASRAGEKLEGALSDFDVNPAGHICLDAGSSAGGFTDCLLQHGAGKIYALDVTTNQLAWKLQSDPRVLPLEMNARYLKRESIPEPPSLVTADLSFISLAKVLPALAAAAAESSEFLLLVKPQFELERGQVGRGGIVRDPELQQRAVERVRKAAEASGLSVLGIRPSCLPGAEGNQEFFLYAARRHA